MRIDSHDIVADGKRVARIRLDRIGNAGDKSLWWVAEAFEDETTKPEGMFTDEAAARALAQSLADQWGVPVSVSQPS
jgi:phage head maturation protease